MKISIGFLLSLSFILLLSCSKKNNFSNGTWVDLSYDFSPETIYWPTADGFTHDSVFVGVTPGGFYYEAFNFKSAEHGGTHIDAPIHFAEGKKSVDQLPITQLVGESIVIDVSEQALSNPDYLVVKSDFETWENKNGKIPDDCIVLIKTGYGKFWPDRKTYMGTDKLGPEGVAELHFPGLHPDAATWLVENRKIKAIGLDTPSIDYGQSKLFESHQNLFKNNIPAFENVANLDKLPEKGFIVFAFPMKIKDGSGGPLRIAAFIPKM